MVRKSKSLFSSLALGTALSAILACSAVAQTVANIKAAELLMGFSQLNSTPQGQVVLNQNLDVSIATNNNATAAERQQAIYDDTGGYLLGSLFNGMLASDALGPQLSHVYQQNNNISKDYKVTTFSDNFSALMSQVAALTVGGDSAFSKNFFANGSVHGNPADQAQGITLPNDGQYNVYDHAYHPDPANANKVGNSRPIQVAPNEITSFDGKDYFGSDKNNTKDILPGLITNASFPSGHSASGFATTMLMAMMVPERYQEFLTRGGEYGNSRVVLGAHYALDVMGARIQTTYALAQILNNNPDYLNQNIKSITGQPVTTTSDFYALFLAAQSDLRTMLNAGCYGDLTICTSAKSPEDRFADHMENKRKYNEWLTYGLSPVGATNLDPVVPVGAEILLATRFPYLTKQQLREVLATTELQSGMPLDNGSGWARLNLFNAADGYGAFNGEVNITMDASKGGFDAYDTWYNDIGDYISPSSGAVSQGSLTKNGSGTLELAGFSHWTGDTTINGGSLVFTGNADLSGALTNNATVALTSPFNSYPGHKLNIGSYHGGESSTLILSAQLNGDTSAHDQLTVTGDATGQSHIQIVKAGGYGAATGDGIKLVEVQGQSSANFTLSNGDYVTRDGKQSIIQGIYGYSLYQGGVSNPYDGNWYLRSHYQPAVPVYESYGQNLLELNQVGTLRERIGSRYFTESSSLKQDATDAQNTHGGNGAFWGKVSGGYSEYKPDVSTSQADSQTTIYKMEAGLDGRFMENKNGQLIGGVLVSYANGSSDITSHAGDGKIDTDGYSVGATLTWYANSGFYVDGQLRGSWYRSSLDSSVLGGLATSNDGTGYAVSAEMGQRLQLSNGWIMTPQAQLSWSSVDFDDLTDAYHVDVRLDKAESLRARLGLSLEKETVSKADNGTETKTSLYGIANLYNEFADGVRVRLNGERFDNRNDRLWGGVGAGINHQWNDGKYSLYGEGAINSSLQNIGDSYSLKASGGFKVRW